MYTYSLGNRKREESYEFKHTLRRCGDLLMKAVALPLLLRAMAVFTDCTHLSLIKTNTELELNTEKHHIYTNMHIIIRSVCNR